MFVCQNVSMNARETVTMNEVSVTMNEVSVTMNEVSVTMNEVSLYTHARSLSFYLSLYPLSLAPSLSHTPRR